VELASLPELPLDKDKRAYWGENPLFLIANVTLQRPKFKGDTAVGWNVEIEEDKEAEDEDRINNAIDRAYKTKIPQVYNVTKVYYPKPFGNTKSHMDSLNEAAQFSHKQIVLGQREYNVLKTPRVEDKFVEYLCKYNGVNCQIVLFADPKKDNWYKAGVTFGKDSSWYFDLTPRN